MRPAPAGRAAAAEKPAGRARRRRPPLPRPHGRPWAGAFNVVMAAAIVSIASRLAGLQPASIVLLWVAIVCFAPLAVLDLQQARHPLLLLHEADDPEHAFTAFGFVADTCVLGARLSATRGITRALAAVLLAAGALSWLAIVVAIVRSRGQVDPCKARGEWLLPIVATEGIAILLSKLAAGWRAPTLHAGATVLWLLGLAGYLVFMEVLFIRLRRARLRPRQLTPDWWIVMGAPAIITAAGASLGALSHGGPRRNVVLAAWIVASLALAALIAAEIWRARHVGLPTFTPARWTTVFPLGMYSTACQLAGAALSLGWLRELGRLWLTVALAAWLLVASGELHHVFAPGSQAADSRAGRCG